jgi:pimeloyl-ACP methyl ester carboxylesterase
MSFDALLADGVFLSVTCNEDLRFVTEDDVARETAGTFLGDYRVRRQLAACAEWPSSAAPGEEHLAPVRADLPVLLLSGALDPATPAEGAERAARDLPQSRHVVAPNTAHGFAPGGCERRVLLEFLENASLDELDASCVSDTRLPPFETAAPAQR